MGGGFAWTLNHSNRFENVPITQGLRSIAVKLGAFSISIYLNIYRVATTCQILVRRRMRDRVKRAANKTTEDRAAAQQ